jgi:hypothetical protein
MNLLELENSALVLLHCLGMNHPGARVSRSNSNRQIQNHFRRKESFIGAIKKSLPSPSSPLASMPAVARPSLDQRRRAFVAAAFRPADFDSNP